MIADITIGQYFPGNSILHRLDPRIKIVLTFVFIIMVFVAQSAYSLGCMIITLIMIIQLSAIPLTIICKGIRPILPILLFTSFLNIFYVQGDVLYTILFLSISKQGLLSASTLSIRLLCLIAGSSLLTYTTSMNALTDGLERLMSPLQRFNIPVNDIAMMITITLRFIPILVDEIDKITNAQKARGAQLDSGGFIKRTKAYFPIIIPLFMSSFRHAYDLSNAIECRCYNGGYGRTKMNVMQMGRLDRFAILFFIIIFFIITYFNIYFPLNF